MKVIATAEGYDNLAVRKPGDEFEMPDGSTAPWFTPVDAEPAKKGSKAKASDKPAEDPIA